MSWPKEIKVLIITPAEAINPKIISVHRADEEPIEIKQAVGQNNIVKIDKAKMIRNLEKRQEE